MTLFGWLMKNYMKANADRSQLFLSGNNNLTAHIERNVIESEDHQVLPGVPIDSNLDFNSKCLNNLLLKSHCKT